MENTAGGSTSPQDAVNAPTKIMIDYLAKNMHLIVGENMFAVIPLHNCPHLGSIQPVPGIGIDVKMPCLQCGSDAENWICLTCYTVGCGRHVNGHMEQHGNNMRHPLTLGFSDLSVWCYECKAYIDNQALFAAKNAAHICKFGSEMPWSYGGE